MLINKINNIQGNVKFISYTASSYNLCGGRLVLEIDGKEWKFGREYDFSNGFKHAQKIPDVHQKFWSSGGGLDNDYCAYQKEWLIDVSRLPEEIQKYAAEIDEVFNENVDWGCCGGCA